jgi:hypothetical protein
MHDRGDGVSDRKRGRRPGPDGPLEATVRVRFTAAEADALFALARREGKDVSPMLRALALTLIRPTETPRRTSAPPKALP